MRACVRMCACVCRVWCRKYTELYTMKLITPKSISAELQAKIDASFVVFSIPHSDTLPSPPSLLYALLSPLYLLQSFASCVHFISPSLFIVCVCHMYTHDVLVRHVPLPVQSLELQLDIFNITVCRQLADNQVGDHLIYSAHFYS